MYLMAGCNVLNRYNSSRPRNGMEWNKIVDWILLEFPMKGSKLEEGQTFLEYWNFQREQWIYSVILRMNLSRIEQKDDQGREMIA